MGQSTATPVRKVPRYGACLAITITSFKHSDSNVRNGTLTNVSQQKAISKGINKSPIYICCQLQSTAWTEMSLIVRPSLPVRVTACVKYTDLLLSKRDLSLHVALVIVMDHQGRLPTEEPNHYFCALLSGQWFLNSSNRLMPKTLLKGLLRPCSLAHPWQQLVPVPVTQSHNWKVCLLWSHSN